MKSASRILLLGALAALCASHSDAAANDVRIPAVLPTMADVKTPAIVPHKGAAEIELPSTEALAPQAKTHSSASVKSSLWNEKAVLCAETAGGVDASAHGWKAQFRTSGTSFVPYFGADAPRSEPILFDVRGLAVDGRTVESRASSVTRVANRVRIERGDVDEAYELSSDGIEQLFVVDAPVDGELRVRVGFSGKFEATQDEDGVYFENDLGRVLYGAARAIDARGASVEVAEHLEGDSIELVVPKEWLAHAAYPVTIDPKIASFTVSTNLTELTVPDVAYEGVSGAQAFVFERVFSAVDHDVYVRKIYDSGVVDPLLFIDSSTENWAAPSIASNRNGSAFLVACEVGAAGARHVRTRTLSANGSVIGPVAQLSIAYPGEQIAPVVGGDPSDLSPSYFFVAYLRTIDATDRDIHGQLVTSNGSPTGPIQILDNSFQTFDSNLAISKCDGTGTASTQHWALVWERRFSSTDQDVYGMEIKWDGSIRTTTFSVLASSSNERAPSVSSPTNELNGERSYVVAVQRGATTGNYDTMLTAMRHGVLVNTMNLDLAAASPFDSFSPAIECDGVQFAVASSVWIGLSDYDIDLNQVSLVDGQLSVNENGQQFLEVGNQPDQMPVVAAKHSGGADSTQFVFGWRTFENGTNYAVKAAVWEGPRGGFVSAYCGGPTSACPCGTSGTGQNGCPNSGHPNGALLGVNGQAAVGADTMLLIAAGLPQGAPTLFFQGTVAGANGVGLFYGDGLLCVAGTITRLGVVFSSNGNALYPNAGDAPVSSKGLVPNTGGMRTYQVWYRDALSFCTSSTFNLTNGVKALWVP